MIPRIKTSVETRQLFTDAQCEVVEARIGRNSKAFFIRIRDPGCKNSDPGKTSRILNTAPYYYFSSFKTRPQLLLDFATLSKCF
jgi:hypothetical protein